VSDKIDASPVPEITTTIPSSPTVCGSKPIEVYRKSFDKAEEQAPIIESLDESHTERKEEYKITTAELEDYDKLEQEYLT
jgi:hypothetical protein